MSNFYNRLILFPQQFDSFINIEPVLGYLREIKLLKESWQYQQQTYYLAGENFNKYIIFMGCSPHIAYKPDKNNEPLSNFTAVKLSQFEQAHFFQGKSNFKYRCPNCKSSINLSDYHGKIIKSDQKFNCNECNENFNWNSVNWRHKAALSYFFIQIMGIFESEAIPADELLNGLKSLTNTKWNYFYMNQEIKI